MSIELKVISDFYDFMLWTIKHTKEFPRHKRYSLGIAIENMLQKLLGLFLWAKYSRDKTDVLNEANIELEILRFQIRLAKDLKVLPVKSHGYAANPCGRQSVAVFYEALTGELHHSPPFQSDGLILVQFHNR